VERPTVEGHGEVEEGKQKRHVGDLLADGRCSSTVLDYLHVGRTALPVEENWDSEDEAEKAVAVEGKEQAK